MWVGVHIGGPFWVTIANSCIVRAQAPIAVNIRLHTHSSILEVDLRDPKASGAEMYVRCLSQTDLKIVRVS